MNGRRVRIWLKGALAAIGVAVLTAGCGKQYVVLHPAGPVAQQELNLMVLVTIAMAVIIVPVIALFLYTLWKFRDRPGNKAPYMPTWRHNKRLELIVWVVPAIIVVWISIPTVGDTFSLTHLPKAADPVTIDVTSVDYKWLFEYPAQHVATINYVVMPKGVPVLFELTANSPMNTFWVPQLGGMEYTMPGRVLPLWLEASRTGVFWGHSGQFSGVWFEKMFFTVRSVNHSTFNAWVSKARKSAPMTLADYYRLLKPTVVGVKTFGAYPADTFPSTTHGFTLKGGMYLVPHDNPREN